MKKASTTPQRRLQEESPHARLDQQPRTEFSPCVAPPSVRPSMRPAGPPSNTSPPRAPLHAGPPHGPPHHHSRQPGAAAPAPGQHAGTQPSGHPPKRACRPPAPSVRRRPPQPPDLGARTQIPTASDLPMALRTLASLVAPTRSATTRTGLGPQPRLPPPQPTKQAPDLRVARPRSPRASAPRLAGALARAPDPHRTQATTGEGAHRSKPPDPRPPQFIANGAHLAPPLDAQQTARTSAPPWTMDLHAAPPRAT